MEFEDLTISPQSSRQKLDDGHRFDESILINEIQLLLAEKRTSLALLRTGIAVFALPLSVLSVLVATSRYYNVSQVLSFLVPLLAICTVLTALGSYLVIRAITRIHHYDSQINDIKEKHSRIAELLK